MCDDPREKTTGAPAPAWLRRPSIVAALFAPIAASIWLLQTRSLGLSEAATRTGLEFVQLVMLLAGAVLYRLASRGRAGPAVLGDHRRWLAAALAAVALVAAHVALAEARVAAAVDPLIAAALLLKLVLFVGLAEELWFRGLWMGAARGSLAVAVGVGALGFGLLHWPFGLGPVATTAATGALYGAARWRGAPLWALALAHGGVDWVSQVIVPAATWRLDPVFAQAMFCVIILIVAGALLWRGVRGHGEVREPSGFKGAGDNG